MITVISYFGLLFISIYFVIILFYIIGWLRIKNSKSEPGVQHTKVSVIIAARNEAQNIETCLLHLIQQNYPKELFEVIVVDDDSSDNTYDVINKVIAFNQDFTINCIQLMEDKNVIAHKKRAITEGIKNAKGDLIITTDADCIMNTKWLSSMVSLYETKKPKMIIAPVCFYNEQSILEKMQSLELIGLMCVTGASAFYAKPLMCNGANLAYEKKVFIELNGFDGIDDISSGDDVLFMLKVSERYANEICFFKSTDAVVETLAMPTLKLLIQQRIRWASKSLKVKNKWLKNSSVIVFMANFFVLCFLGLLFVSPLNSLIMVGLFAKWLIDFILLLVTAVFFKKKKLLTLFIPEQIMYSVYVVFIAIMSTFGNYRWKERTVK